MQLFEHSGYHKLSKEKPKTFLDKALGLAAVAGLVTTAAYTIRPLAATAAFSYARSALLKSAATAAETAGSELFSNSWRIATEMPEAFGRAAASQAAHTTRAETFLGQMVGSIDMSHFQGPLAPGTTIADEAQKLVNANRTQLLQMLNKVAKAENISEINADFLSGKSLHEFNRRAQKLGITFGFHNLNEQENTFRLYSEVAFKAKAREREAINAVTNDITSQKTLIDTANNARDIEERKHRKVLNILGLNKGQVIRGADLQDPKIASAVNEMLATKGHGRADAQQTTIEDILKHADEALTKNFSYVDDAGTEVIHEGLRDAFIEMRNKADTGLRLVQGKNGNVHVVSVPHLLQSIERGATNLINDIQLPLVPGLFQPRIGRMFTGSMPSKDLFKNLQEVTNHPELMRLLGNEVSGTDHLLGVGDLILKMGNDYKLGEVQGTFTTFDRRSPLLSHVADARGQELIDYMEDSEGAKRFLGGDKRRSKLYKTAMSNHHKYADYGYSEGAGFTVQPLDPSFVPVYESLFGIKASEDGLLRGVDVRDLNPVKLAELLKTHDPNSFDPSQYLAAVEHIVSEGSKGGSTISEFLRGTVSKWIESGQAELHPDEDFFIRNVIQNIDNPKEIQHLLKSKVGGMSAPIVSQSSRLRNTANPRFYKSIETLSVDPESLGDVRENEGNIFAHLKSKLFGATAVSASKEGLEEGILGQVLHAKGRQRFANMFGYERFDENELAGVLSQVAAPGADVPERVLESLRSLGVTDSDGVADLLGKTIYFDKEGIPRLNQRNAGRLGTVLLSQEGLFEEVNGGVAKAKVAKLLMDDLQILDSTDPNFNFKGRHAKIVSQIYQDAELNDTVALRFAGRSYHPQDEPLDVFSKTRHYVTVNGDTGDFFNGMVSADQPLGPAGAIFQGLMQRPQEIANMAGLGLPGQDLVTVGRTMFGFYAKRIAPLFLAYEAYKNVNANLHQMGMNGLDDWGANFLANVQLGAASLGDATGITEYQKKLNHLIPGLDNYFHPRSEQEERENLLYGDEQVRTGRFWLIGSRDAFHGGKVEFDRPNYYRRWHSHWTEASNVDYSNPAYSWLPSPLHPFAPINLMLHPHWWENKHIADRPYKSNGMFADQSNYNAEPFGDYLTVNSAGTFNPLTTPRGPFKKAAFWHKQTSPYGDITSIGTFGDHLAPKLTGGYAPHEEMEPNGPGITPGQDTYQQGSEIAFGLHKQLKGPLLNNYSHKALEFFRSKSGLYAAPIQLFTNTENNVYLTQDSHYAHSSTRMLYSFESGGLLGPYSEFFRRFIRPDEQDFNAYSPYTNNMPSWLPKKFTTGDPYVRTPAGELNLPGEAFEKASEWVKPLRVRGSVIGYSENEIIKKWLNPMEEIEGEEAENIVGFGTRAHLLIQRQLKKQGILLAAEVPIFDEAHNISGTIDAIVKGSDGYEIFDIKTQGQRGWGTTPDKYIDQINTYMAITGIKKAHLAFVNRDDMKQVRIEDFDFDPERWNKTLAKVARARQTIQMAVAKGQVSPYETYDLLARIQVLARVAPNSAEFNKAVSFANKSGGFGGFEAHLYERSLEEAKKLKEDYNLYPNRFGQKTETHYVFVQGISDNGDIITNKGVVKLAGVKFDSQAFIDEDAPRILSKYGVTVGRFVSVTVLQGQWNDEVMTDKPIKAIVGGTNHKLVKSQYATTDDTDRHPLSEKVSLGTTGNPVLEKMLHLDSMITNKFMRVRTGLEQFERGEVYGTDKTNWKHPFRTFVSPTLDAIASKNPLMAAVKGGTIASLLFFSSKNKKTAAVVGAVLAAGMSLSRIKEESRTGEAWLPQRYTKQNDVDEYWDKLNYMKYTSIAEDAKRKAFWLEHTNINKLLVSGERKSVGLGPWGTLAVYANKKAKETMYGTEAATETLQQALEAIPARHRQIAESIIDTGSLKEKQRFYDLLPKSEKRLLGKFLNVNYSDLPNKEKLEEYFKTHFLPDKRWEGWGVEVDTNDLKTRSQELEHVDITPPSRASLVKARDYTKNIEIPMVYSPTAGNIRNRITDILVSGGHRGINAGFVLRPSTRHHVEVQMDIAHDDSEEFAQKMKNLS